MNGMSGEISSSQVITELMRIRQEMGKGAEALYQAEVKLAEAENEAELTLQRGYIKATGTNTDRVAISRLEAADARFQADLRKAEVNRIKTKLKHLELAQMSFQSIGRQLELEAKIG
jgi:regulator of protease activity HflC (stomatin/prohibitin superfamily)